MSEQTTTNKPAKRRRELVPIAVTKIRIGPNFDDAIMPGEEVPRHLLNELIEKIPDKNGRIPAIHHYVMGSYVESDRAG